MDISSTRPSHLLNTAASMKTLATLAFAEPVIGMVLDCGPLLDSIEISLVNPLSRSAWYRYVHPTWLDDRCDQLEAIIAGGGAATPPGLPEDVLDWYIYLGFITKRPRPTTWDFGEGE